MRQCAYDGTPTLAWFLCAFSGMRRRPMTLAGLDKWYAFMKSSDHAALFELLHLDMVLESPVLQSPQRGRDITFRYLAGAVKVLGRPCFFYRGEWRNDTGAVLEFET